MLNAPPAKSAFAVSGVLPAPTIEGRMLCASGLTYSIPVSSLKSKKLPPDFQIPQTAPFYSGVGYIIPPITIQNGDAACTIGQNKDGIIIAFRGTVYNSASDWLADIMLSPKTAQRIPGKVHSGFYDNFKLIHNQIYTYLGKYPGKNIYITGHSKGAGMAPIAAYFLYSNYTIMTKQVFLFASPNPGDSEFASAYNSKFPNTFSYVNNVDIVPIFPPSPAVAGDLLTYVLTAQAMSNKEKATMIALLGSDAFSDYARVGNNINFISTSEEGKYKIEPLTSAVLNQQQLPAIENALSTENFYAFVAAHSHMCGYGYMNAICPTVTCLPYTSAN